MASKPRLSTAAPVFPFFHALYAANFSPIELHKSSVIAVTEESNIDLIILKFLSQTGFIAAFIYISDFPVI